MVRTLRLELPEPPPELSPNARTHPFVRRKAQRMAHAEVSEAVDNSSYELGSPITNGIVKVTFIVPTRADRDKGNLI